MYLMMTMSIVGWFFLSFVIILPYNDNTRYSEDKIRIAQHQD
jgi:hypothetical protein